MALFGPMRPKLLELNTFEILHRALADNLDCVNDVVAECSSAFISNMSMSTNQRLPEARDWAETISPHVTTMLEVMSIVGEKGYDEMAVLHAYGYAIASMCEQPVTLKQLLVKSSHQRYVMKFLMQHSRGEDRDAAQSMVPKLCIKSLIILVRAALDSTEGSNEEFLPGFDDDIAKEALEILFKWHIEYYPWIWVHKPSVAQMMPNLLGEYVNIRSDCTKICQIWASKNAYRSTDEAVDKPIVFEACCAVVREMLATPADKLPMTVDNGGLRIGIFSVSPNYDFYVKFAAETGLGDLS
ncbi:hypothetical protein SARC_05420 [Sphaeroforma arctica JP610]|uniref:Uncharacterized protein n=1 Tax=Sphaeroforma arctica JP610 TaxID=667725 RepID=A0A0L0G0D6_9EUKA|nr:hypothetical protein SARC_05420 [Sphaeroforma arctica JP610]KNC82301.1 hypothetical protein SARC_05420 [Sphaeroforma arctica JP610]|eukprot:XP_014156203.1 hypothetical protein SARC_05420 [Sphaeroforma arctica JP610]